MCGFVADYDKGEIIIDNNEIVAASCFDRDHLTAMPSNLRLTRALIAAWLSGKL